jgi:exonuclease III
MYVPNRGNDGLKIERKRSFLDSWLQYLAQKAPTNQQRVLVGDLNVVPTSQHPVFLPQHVFENRWYEQLQSHAGLYDAALMHHHRHESTWVAHTGEGYTYDHIMPAKGLCDRVVAFAYDHSPRLSTNVSDHSALILTMNFDSVAYLHRNPPTELKQMDLL